MLNYSRRILCSQQDAEDAVQETFANLYKHLDKLMGMKEEEVKGYVFRAVHNVSINMVKQKKRTCAAEDSELEQQNEAEKSAEREALGSLSFDEMVEIAVSIDPEYGKMIRLKYEQDKDTNEIAKELGRPVDSTRALMSRMIARLRKKLRGGDWE